MPAAAARALSAVAQALCAVRLSERPGLGAWRHGHGAHSHWRMQALKGRNISVYPVRHIADRTQATALREQ